jgi:hypothetical protein
VIGLSEERAAAANLGICQELLKRILIESIVLREHPTIVMCVNAHEITCIHLDPDRRVRSGIRLQFELTFGNSAALNILRREPFKAFASSNRFNGRRDLAVL